MKFIHSTLALIPLLASAAVAAPPPPANSGQPIPPPAATGQPVPPPPGPRDMNYCSKTGEESCNFWIHSIRMPIPVNVIRFWKVFDSQCNEIGGARDALDNNDGRHSLTSQLPDPIELSLKSTTDLIPQGHFSYADQTVPLKNMFCKKCPYAEEGEGPQSDEQCCRVAFTCR